MLRQRLILLLTLATTTLALAAPATADAQGLGDRLRRRAEEAAKKKVEERAAQRAGEATDAALDAVECAATDRACIEQAEKDGKRVVAPGATDSAAATAAGRPGEGAWLNYDFVPGERVLFADVFAKDAVGDFPKRLEYGDGNMEVAEWQGSRYLRTTSWPATFSIQLAEQLPERFTLEFDYTGRDGADLEVRFADKATHHVFVRDFAQPEGGIKWDGGQARAKGTDAVTGRLFRARVMADGRYVKVYIDGTRVANVPNAQLGRSTTITFSMPGDETDPAFIGNIRLAAGGRDLYDAIAEKGRVATQGILFDTGSDRIRPESTPTLKEIGAMLTEHPELKLTIEGHTDDVGDAAANQALSEKRAVAVKAYLVAQHGIDESRLSATGLGESKPAAPNTTPEGQQQNRRVELVKR